MNPEQLKEYRRLLELGRVSDDRLSDQRVYLRGFNDGIKFAQEQLGKITRGDKE